MMERVPVREAAAGRWRDILSILGVPDRALSGKPGPCPVCGNLKPKFRFDDKEGRGTWICTCSSGDGMALAMKITGLDFHHAAMRVEELVGTARQSPPKPQRSERNIREAMNTLWRSASPIGLADPAGRWLRNRVGLHTVPAVLRCAPWSRHVDCDGVVTHHPCMIAMVMDARGRPASLHRTYLTKDGQKADVEPQRSLMPGGVPDGAAVRLFPPAERMGIAEGIETAFAAANLFGMPVWSALNASILAKWEPPPEATEVVIFGDNDPKFGGQAKAWQLAHRLACKGIITSVEIPPTVGKDWNDVLAEAVDAA